MQTFLTDAGYWALIIFAFVEACCIPISSEITFGFAGVLAFDHKLSLALVIIIGSLAEFAGSYTSYAIGRKGGRRTVERFRRYVLMTRRDVERAEGFFAGRGAWAVTVGRVLPLVRAFTGLVAGLVEVPAGPFAIFNMIGTVIWASALSLIGYSLGSDWNKIEKSLSYFGYAIVGLVIVALVAHKLHQLRKERAEDAELADAPASTPRARHRASSNLRDR
jgi:membrane protein DedA with SNARE-associated domain